MGKEINITEILKDKPQGTKLYDLLYNVDVELDTISTTDTDTMVWCTNEIDNNTTCHRGYSEFGTVRECPDGLQILLPSKEMRDWRKFAWKKGDVLVSKGNVHIIFEKFEDDAYTRFKGKHYLWKECDEEDYSKEETKMLTSIFEKPTMMQIRLTSKPSRNAWVVSLTLRLWKLKSIRQSSRMEIYCISPTELYLVIS
nr:hypothetical protein [uncultured Prevotella sp.]